MQPAAVLSIVVSKAYSKTLSLDFFSRTQLRKREHHMDLANDEPDIQVEKTSAGLVSEFDRSIISFLRKQNKNGRYGLRCWVPASETNRLVSSVRPTALFLHLCFLSAGSHVASGYASPTFI